MAEVGLEEMNIYVLHRNNTIVQYIASRPILDLCMAVEQRLGAQMKLWW